MAPWALVEINGMALGYPPSGPHTARGSSGVRARTRLPHDRTAGAPSGGADGLGVGDRGQGRRAGHRHTRAFGYVTRRVGAARGAGSRADLVRRSWGPPGGPHDMVGEPGDCAIRGARYLTVCVGGTKIAARSTASGL